MGMASHSPKGMGLFPLLALATALVLAGVSHGEVEVEFAELTPASKFSNDPQLWENEAKDAAKKDIESALSKLEQTKKDEQLDVLRKQLAKSEISHAREGIFSDSFSHQVQKMKGDLANTAKMEKSFLQKGRELKDAAHRIEEHVRVHSSTDLGESKLSGDIKGAQWAGRIAQWKRQAERWRAQGNAANDALKGQVRNEHKAALELANQKAIQTRTDTDRAVVAENAKALTDERKKQMQANEAFQQQQTQIKLEKTSAEQEIQEEVHALDGLRKEEGKEGTDLKKLKKKAFRMQAEGEMVNAKLQATKQQAMSLTNEITDKIEEGERKNTLLGEGYSDVVATEEGRIQTVLKRQHDQQKGFNALITVEQAEAKSIANSAAKMMVHINKANHAVNKIEDDSIQATTQLQHSDTLGEGNPGYLRAEKQAEARIAQMKKAGKRMVRDVHMSNVLQNKANVAAQLNSQSQQLDQARANLKSEFQKVRQMHERVASEDQQDHTVLVHDLKDIMHGAQATVRNAKEADMQMKATMQTIATDAKKEHAILAKRAP